ncbi:LPXTG cell wall anchor domain-containing protein [Streptomyces sp. HUAS TT3]|uniref:LPXTG cell wall anchor domain-containing protein n=1 Tax=Streptomyces sp. HUAS TT3 TaxID=3447510 RepID=UPI003F65B2EC
MPARTAVRRPVRAAAAAAVVAAVAGTALAPLSAFAAPAEDGGVLQITMGAPDHDGKLKPGGTPGTFELTVTNPSDKVRAFHPSISGIPTGPSPLQQNDVTFQVEAVGDTPASESAVLQQDSVWRRVLRPTGKTGGFEVPAGGKLTWKVTVGLGASYPTNLGDFELRASTTPESELAKDGGASLTFKRDPAVKVGEFNTWIDGIGACEGSTAPDCRELNMKYVATGEGRFNTALGSRLVLKSPELDSADLQVRAQVDGKWQDAKADSGKFTLPVALKDFGAASGERSTRVQIKLGPKSKLTKVTAFEMATDVFLNEGNTYPFTGIKGGKIDLAPAQGASSPSPSPSTSASPSPDEGHRVRDGDRLPQRLRKGGKIDLAPAQGASASPSASASTTAAAGTTTGTTGSSGSLASTGADSNTGLYSALAAALVAAGGAAVWLGARRRRAASQA